MSDARAWVGCLACYNGGELKGEWVDGLEAGEYVPCTVVEFGSPHEEWWVFDHEGYDGWIADECSPVTAQERAELIEAIEQGGEDPAVVHAWMSECGIGEITEWDRPTRESYEDAKAGSFGSWREFAEEHVDSLGLGGLERSQLESIWNYLDWDIIAGELQHEYTAIESGGDMHFFHQR